jgi:hypothetical protein
MTTAEPDRSPVRVAHLALGGGQLVVVYIRGARVEVPIYPADDGPLNEAGEVEPAIVVDLTVEEAATLASMLGRAVVRADDDGCVGEDAVAGGLLDNALTAASEIDRAFNGILPHELSELSDRLAVAATAWKKFLDAELGSWRHLRLVTNDEDGGDR